MIVVHTLYIVIAVLVVARDGLINAARRLG